MRNMMKKALLIATVVVSCAGSVFAAYNTAAYDHAVRGQYFDPNAMVTMLSKTEYLPRYQITNYYLYLCRWYGMSSASRSYRYRAQYPC